MKGGIIAAGLGTRLRTGKWEVPKPLVPVAGIPLLERVIQNFQAANIMPLTIIFNEEISRCKDWAQARFSHLELDILIKTTASSLESFLEVSSRMGEGPALISTVDAWCSPEDFVKFVNIAKKYPPDALVLGVTSFVDDERPLWVNTGNAGRVITLGEPSGETVTAGLYVVPEQIRTLTPPKHLERLRDFLIWVVKEGTPTFAVPVETVIDVDRPEDVTTAEKMESGAKRKG